MYPGNSSEHSPLSVQLSGSDYNITSVWMKNFDLGIGLQYVNEIFASGCYVISGFFEILKKEEDDDEEGRW